MRCCRRQSSCAAYTHKYSNTLQFISHPNRHLQIISSVSSLVYVEERLRLRQNAVHCQVSYTAWSFSSQSTVPDRYTRPRLHWPRSTTVACVGPVLYYLTFDTQADIICSDICKIIVAIFLPPVGVALEKGIGSDFCINILLTILGYIPGIIHALYAIPPGTRR